MKSQGLQNCLVSNLTEKRCGARSSRCRRPCQCYWCSKFGASGYPFANSRICIRISSLNIVIIICASCQFHGCADADFLICINLVLTSKMGRVCANISGWFNGYNSVENWHRHTLSITSEKVWFATFAISYARFHNAVSRKVPRCVVPLGLHHLHLYSLALSQLTRG